MNNNILLIIPYFGKFNNYFRLFLGSCRHNPTINWLIFTDDETKYSYPNNVKVVYTTLHEVRQKIEERLGFSVALETPYKLCDFKPAYGYVFSEYLDRYDFWGYCDTDMIFGDIRSFITDDILNKSDKVLSRGHLSLWRNCRMMNEFFMTSTDGFYKTVFTTERNFSFDEWGKDGVANYLKKQLPENRFWDEIPYDDIHMLKGNFVSSQRGAEGQSHTIYSYEQGKLKRYSFVNTSFGGGKIGCKSVLYVHFQKRNMIVKSERKTDKFIITPPNLFLPYQEITSSVLLSSGRKIWIYPQYFTIRYRNLLRKIRNFFKR